MRRPAEARSRPTVRRLGCGTPARRGGGASPTTYRGMCRARGAGRRAKTRGCGTTRPKKGEGRAAELDQGGHARPRSGPKPGGTLLGAAACSGRDPDGVLVYAERVAGRARRPSQRASTVAPTEAAGLEGRDEAGRAVQGLEGRGGKNKTLASATAHPAPPGPSRLSRRGGAGTIRPGPARREPRPRAGREPQPPAGRRLSPPGASARTRRRQPRAPQGGRAEGASAGGADCPRTW